MDDLPDTAKSANRARGAIGRADLLRAHESGLVLSELVAGEHAYRLEPTMQRIEIAEADPGVTESGVGLPSLVTESRLQLQRLWILADRQPREMEQPSLDEADEAQAPSEIEARPDPEAFAAWVQQLSFAGAAAIARKLAQRIRDQTGPNLQGPIDAAELSERVARRRSLTPLPRRQRLSCPDFTVVIDASRSLVPLWNGLRELARLLKRELPVRGIVEIGDFTELPQLASDSNVLLLSDLRSERTRDWLQRVRACRVRVSCVLPAVQGKRSSDMPRLALGTVDTQRLRALLAALAAVPYWNAGIVLGCAQLLSQEGDAWALSWALWNHQATQSNYSRISVNAPVSGLPPPPLEVLRRYRVLQMYEPEADRALADAYLNAYLPEANATALHRLRNSLLRKLRTRDADGLEACLAVRLAQVAPLRERERDSAAYSELFQRGHQQLGDHDPVMMPAGLLPSALGDRAKLSAWRIVQEDQSLWLMPVRPESPLRRHCLAGDISVSPGDWVTVKSGGSFRPKSVNDRPVLLASDLGSVSEVQLVTRSETLALQAFTRPSWATGFGNDDRGAYLHAPSLTRACHRFNLGAYAGVSNLHVSFDGALEREEPLLASRHAKLSIGIDGHGLFASVSIKGVRQKLRWIEPGEFVMGSSELESEWDDERPQHRVRITHGFWLADTACTQAFWLVVAGDNPSAFQDDLNLPVENVSWIDIVRRFVPALQTAIGANVLVQLPSEAEWEYACRAGSTKAFSFGDTVTLGKINCVGNRPSIKPTDEAPIANAMPVASLPANSWGLYEMHGNVWEWCRDGLRIYSSEPASDPEGPQGQDSSRALRGGCWISTATTARAAYRSSSAPGNRHALIGFRWCLRSLSPISGFGPEGQASGRPRRGNERSTPVSTARTLRSPNKNG